MAVPWAFDTLPVSIAAGGQSLALGVLRTRFPTPHSRPSLEAEGPSFCQSRV